MAGWFARVNDYVKRQSQGKVKLNHYVISAGQKEILDVPVLHLAFVLVHVTSPVRCKDLL